MGLANENHPFARIGEVRKVRIVAWIRHIQIDLQIDQRIALGQGFAFDRDAKLFAHDAAPTIAGEQIRGFDTTLARGCLQDEDDVIGMLHESGQTMRKMHRIGRSLPQRFGEQRFEVMLRHVDHERIARLIP